jgi:hypothetical protein
MTETTASLGRDERVLLNVFFEIPDLIIQPGRSLKNPYATPEELQLAPWEFSFDERTPMGKPAMELKKAYLEEQDIMFLRVEFVDRQERDGKLTVFRPHVIAVKHVHPTHNVDETFKDSVLLALVYKVTAEMEMRLRQTIWRNADPGILKATLTDYDGKKLASSLASQFLLYTLPKKS